MPNFSLLTIFLTGLTTGGLTCLALQGGLLASVISQSSLRPIRSEESGKDTPTKQSPPHKFTVIISFLVGKLLVHTLLGFLLGALGQTITLSPIARGWFQILIGVYLLGIVGNLLNLHPFFRYFVITPPKFLARLVKNESKSQSIFAPFILGLFTVFIPCAVTQATEIIAISTGNPLFGAAIMFSFILGTSPTFLFFGFLLNSGAKAFQKYFPQIASFALFCMALYSINNGIGLTGSVYTFQNFYRVAVHPEVLSASTDKQVVIKQGFQEINITVTNSGYTPEIITLKKDIPVRLILTTINVQSCSRSFTIPALNIQKLLPETGDTVIEFTPKNLGPLAFSCSMGMYTGRFNIIN